MGMSRIIQVRVTGAQARPGEIAASDVARLILGLERAMARAAYLVLGRPRQSASGRHTGAVEAASRLRFVGSGPGSFVQLLALPEARRAIGDELDLPVDDLSRRAFDRLVGFIGAPDDDADVGLAAAVAQLADELGIGERNDTLIVGEPDPGRPQAVVDKATGQRMRHLAQRPPAHREHAVVGLLFEADFERYTARLRLPAGGVVTVSFRAGLADDVQRALRAETQLEGWVRYDTRTGAATSVETRTVVRAEQLLLDDGGWSFNDNPSVVELQQRQGVVGPPDLAELIANDLNEEERDAFLAALSMT